MTRIAIVQIVLAVFLVSGLAVAQLDGSKYNDPETPKIRASFTVAPDTSDIKELRAFISHCQNNWWRQMQGRFKDIEDAEPFMQEKFLAILNAAEKMLTVLQEQGRDEDTNANGTVLDFLVRTPIDTACSLW
ncbi:MAG: hypothetical protein FWE95_11820 [Planctomycetaceae bacterium]|nr:hypothetical protein [Planctomycetaceae bacterium]